jgi:hypothetical protein
MRRRHGQNKRTIGLHGLDSGCRPRTQNRQYTCREYCKEQKTNVVITDGPPLDNLFENPSVQNPLFRRHVVLEPGLMVCKRP